MKTNSNKDIETALAGAVENFGNNKFLSFAANAAEEGIVSYRYESSEMVKVKIKDLFGRIPWLQDHANELNYLVPKAERATALNTAISGAGLCVAALALILSIVDMIISPPEFASADGASRRLHAQAGQLLAQQHPLLCLFALGALLVFAAKVSSSCAMAFVSQHQLQKSGTWRPRGICGRPPEPQSAHSTSEATDEALSFN
jgi:hypothetical protein